MTAHFADGRPVPVADETAEAGWFEALCLEYGKDPLEQMEFIAAYESHFRASTSATREAIEIVDWHKSDLRVLDDYQGSQGIKCDPRLLHLSRRCFILAHGPGYAHIAGADTPTELARQLKLAKLLGQSGKATAHKCFSYFQQMIPCAPLATQRSELARLHMRAARNQQLLNPG